MADIKAFETDLYEILRIIQVNVQRGKASGDPRIISTLKVFVRNKNTDEVKILEAEV